MTPYETAKTLLMKLQSQTLLQVMRLQSQTLACKSFVLTGIKNTFIQIICIHPLYLFGLPLLPYFFHPPTCAGGRPKRQW